MPIKIIEDVRDRALARPIVICDFCSREIQSAVDGNYQWDMQRQEQGSHIAFTHKQCCRAFEDTYPTILWGAIGLECLPIYLIRNLGINVKHATRCANEMAMF